MINWIINHNKKYRQANLWSAALQGREEQKKAISIHTVAQNEMQEVEQSQEMLSQHVIFAKANNEDDSQKMQQIYAELENVSLSPALAFA